MKVVSRPRRLRHQTSRGHGEDSGIEVVTLAGSNMESAREVAQQWKIPHWTTNLAESLAQPGLEAVILTTPTQMHAAQGEQCMRAGKHVMIEIPMADSVADSERLVRVQKETGVVAMAGHTRRFNPSHQWVHKRILAGELKILQMDVQTYFFRRTNMNALGKPRSWTDHLLWHHACHTVDLFGYQTGENIAQSFALQGPKHPTLGIAMDMSIGLKVPSARSAPCRCRSTMTGRWVPSSAISATTAHTSRATTSCWTARTIPSTCPRWTCP
jgi:2-hydroxy-4-carboxymuconate semialdehyde hemiacetal dehydrogenase